MLFPDAENIPKEDFPRILSRLQIVLENLPTQLPDKGPGSQYMSFLNFSLDAELLDKYETEIATLNEQFKRIFGWNSRVNGDGTLPVLERGRSICAAHDVLKIYHEKFPEDNVV